MNGISIIICYYNSGEKILEVFNAINNQVNLYNLPFELIVVNNNSNDETPKLIENYFLKTNYFCKVNFVSEQKAGLAFAREKGFNQSSYKYICFIDDDNVIDSNFFSVCIEILKKDEMIGVLGTNGIGKFAIDLPNFIKSGFPFKTLLNNLAINDVADSFGVLPKTDYVFGACSFYQRSILKNAFDYHLFLSGRKGNILLSGEDGELCHIASLLGYKIFRTKQASYLHIIPAGRLTKDYFDKLYKGFGYSQFVLELYVNQILNKSDFNVKIKLIENKIKSITLAVIYFILLKNLKDKYYKIKLLQYFYESYNIAIIDNQSKIVSMSEKIKSIKNL